MLHQKKLLIFFVIFLPISLYSQSVWTLEQCIQHAYEHNVTIQQRIIAMQSDEIRLKMAKNAWLPTLSGNLGQNFGFGQSPSSSGVYQQNSSSSTSLGISANMPLFTGFQITNQKKASALDLQATMAELEQAKEDLALNVTSFFLQVLFAKELYKIAQQQIELSKQQVEKSQIQFAAGKISESDLVQNKALLANDIANGVQQKQQVMLALLDLSQLLELPSSENFDIEFIGDTATVVLDTLSLSPLDTIYEHALLHRSVVKAAEYKLQRSAYDIKLSKAEHYPTVGLSASYGNGYYYYFKDNWPNLPLADQVRSNSRTSVGININIPIFSRFDTYHRIKLAEFSQKNQEQVLISTKKNVQKEVHQAYYNAVAASEKYQALEQSVDATILSYKYIQKRYDEGKSSIFELNDVKVRLVKAQSECVQSKYDFLFRTKILDFYDGKPIF